MSISLLSVAKTPSPTTIPPGRLEPKSMEYTDMIRAFSNVAQCDADAMTSGHNKPAPTQDLSSLFPYCTVNPAMHVRFRILEYGMTCTIHKATLFQRRLPSCLHGNGTCALWDNHLRFIDERCKTVAIRLSRCRSFRLSFAEGVVFDEGRIRESMNENVWVCEHIVPLHDGGLEECVKVLRGDLSGGVVIAVGIGEGRCDVFVV